MKFICSAFVDFVRNVYIQLCFITEVTVTGAGVLDYITFRGVSNILTVNKNCIYKLHFDISNGLK